jgi:hypothetical protein
VICYGRLHGPIIVRGVHKGPISAHVLIHARIPL